MRYSLKKLLAITLLLCYVLAAYNRGVYLFGAGIPYAFVALLVAFLFVRTLWRTPLPRVQLCLLTLFAIPVSVAFAFPALINPDYQHFIDQQATDRQARQELATLFASDPALSNLSVSTAQLKVVNVTIQGSVPTESDLARLQSRVQDECEFPKQCFIHWEVEVIVSPVSNPMDGSNSTANNQEPTNG